MVSDRLFVVDRVPFITHHQVLGKHPHIQYAMRWHHQSCVDRHRGAEGGARGLQTRTGELGHQLLEGHGRHVPA